MCTGMRLSHQHVMSPISQAKLNSSLDARVTSHNDALSPLLSTALSQQLLLWCQAHLGWLIGHFDAVLQHSHREVG